MKDIEKLKEMISESNHIVFFGGAGVSTESGIPDFRSKDGLYNQYYKYPPEYMLSRSCFEKMPDEFYEKAEPWLKKAINAPFIDLKAVAALVQSRCEILSDLPERVDFLDKLPVYDNELYVHKKSKTNTENSLTSLKAILPVLEGLENW